jgi:hypothetical protein
MVKTLIFTGLILFSKQVSGYSTSTHIVLTQRAIEEYRFCNQTTGAKNISSDEEKIIYQNNISEDTVLWRKVLNWHFFNPTKDLGAGTLGHGHGSFVSRFHKLEQDMQKKPSLKTLGRLTHYVQDVTNPAHVAPVYHTSNDSFDNYNFQENLPPFISASDCQKIAGDANKSYWEVLVSTANHTLSEMNSSFSYTKGDIAQSITWSEAFWDLNYGPGSKKPGFGHYGIFGNQFGSLEIGEYKVDPTVYSNFAKQQTRDALNATILLLEIYQRN